MKRRENGEGTIVKRKDKLWEVKVTLPDRIPDEPVRKSFSGRSKEEAKKNRDDFLLARAEKTKQDLQSQQSRGINTVSELIDEWYPAMKKPKLRPNTRDLYESLIARHIKPGIGAMCLTKIDQLEVQKFYNRLGENGSIRKPGMGLSAATIKQVHNIVRQSLAWAYDMELISKEFYKKLSVASPQAEERKAMSLEDALRFYRACKNHKLGHAFRLALLYGLRRGEVLALKWDKVLFDKGEIHIHRSLSRGRTGGLRIGPPKTGKRELPLFTVAEKELSRGKAGLDQMQAHYGDEFDKERFVFFTESGNPVDPQNFVRDFHGFLDVLGIERIRFHDLRHSSASVLEHLGVPMRARMAILGHKDYRTAMRYTHVIPGTLKNELKKMGAYFSSLDESDNENGAV